MKTRYPGVSRCLRLGWCYTFQTPRVDNLITGLGNEKVQLLGCDYPVLISCRLRDRRQVPLLSTLFVSIAEVSVEVFSFHHVSSCCTVDEECKCLWWGGDMPLQLTSI